MPTQERVLGRNEEGKESGFEPKQTKFTRRGGRWQLRQTRHPFPGTPPGFIISALGCPAAVCGATLGNCPNYCFPIAERVKGLIKQVDLLYKLASRLVAAAAELAPLKSEISNVKSPDPVPDLRNTHRLLLDLTAMIWA